ncbi:isoprenyl transferase [candidate division BRC1 bacterium HGW-BRC1-1]|nr:MAG: isoprenyl transferase [candidate division BRC1 bacterium HGW-BRC1-1]
MTSSNLHTSLASKVRETLTPEEDQILAQITPERIPRHIAIIMDGNGRWARRQGFLDRVRGHEAGIDSVRTAVRACGELGVAVLTLYAFSVENWQRPGPEVSALMHMLKKFLLNEIDELNTNNVRLQASGRLEDLSADVRDQLAKSMAATAGNTGMVLNLALSYGGRTELLSAVQTIAKEVADGKLAPEAITEETIAAHLYHPELGDPDLLIRTSGELRVSNFLLWQIAYTEIYVTPVLWPDFRRRELYEAVLDYEKRERRFGRV